MFRGVGASAPLDPTAVDGWVAIFTTGVELVDTGARGAVAAAAVVIEANLAGSIGGARADAKGPRVQVGGTAISAVVDATTWAGGPGKAHELHAPQVMVDRVPPEARQAGPCAPDGPVVIKDCFS